MGYRSTVKIDWFNANGKPITDAQEKKIAKLFDDSDRAGSLSYDYEYVGLGEAESRDELKFYPEYRMEIAKALAKIKGVIFHFEIDGEDAGDLWDCFFLDGKIQVRYAEVVRFDKPDDTAGWETPKP